MFGTLTFGINPKAKAGFLSNFIPKGTVTVGIGDNLFYGGTNESTYGFAGHHSCAGVDLDGKRIIEDGRFVV